MNKEKLKKKTNNFFNTVIHIYIYGAIFGLVSYMLTSLVGKAYKLIEKLIGSKNGVLNDISLKTLQHQLLHDIAFTLVLVKAYNILMEYAKTRHINIKYTLEIAIIAPVVEIVFNYSSYDFNMTIFLGAFAILMSLLYLFFYEKLQQVEKDYTDRHKN